MLSQVIFVGVCFVVSTTSAQGPNAICPRMPDYGGRVPLPDIPLPGGWNKPGRDKWPTTTAGFSVSLLRQISFSSTSCNA